MEITTPRRGIEPAPNPCDCPSLVERGHRSSASPRPKLPPTSSSTSPQSLLYLSSDSHARPPPFCPRRPPPWSGELLIPSSGDVADLLHVDASLSLDSSYSTPPPAPASSSTYRREFLHPRHGLLPPRRAPS